MKFLKELFKPIYKLTIVQKISLAGILIVLVALFQKVFAINYIPVSPFVRISFGGPALIIFSSILLGPWFGLLVGAASDIVGFFIFDPKNFGAMPFFQITFIYALLGFLPFFVYKLVNLITNKKLMICIELGVFFSLLLTIVLFCSLDYSVDLALWARIVIPVVAFTLLAVVFVTSILLDKYFTKRGYDIKTINNGFTCFVLEMTVMVLFGSLMKAWAFSSFTFWIIFVSQVIVAFFNIPLNTFLVSYIMNLSKKLIKVEKDEKED